MPGSNGGAKFVTDFFSEADANVVAFGVECPPSLREASQLVEPFDFTDRRNWLENARVFDAGEVKMDAVEKKTKEILAEKKLPLILAKEHTITLHAMNAMPAGTKLVVFDAHADVKDEYEGSRFSHACWLRRWCEVAGDNGANVALVGVRSGDEEELEFLKSTDMKFFTADDVRRDADAVANWLAEFVGDDAFYLSLDMDVFDPSIAPAVKYPEPNGISWDAFLEMLHALEEGGLIGMDCNEIRPIAGSMVTEFVAVKSVFRILDVFVG
ncbi:MAG: arginase family protein [Candidatus Aenigmarchaeota archaeon]|nr:arginase family protein [Candidatus Aenigmarchaeota archaeon]